VEELGISDKVIFAGAKKDVYKYYNAMDFFLYPSRYEGLPGTVVEAQASGISCLISDSICEEVVLTDLVKTKALSDGVEDWADECIKMMDIPEGRQSSGDGETGDAQSSTAEASDMQPSADDTDALLAKRRQYAKKVYDAGFDVTLQAQKFTRFYEGGKYE
nr:glycosyltransferase [Lachnospiraceae bacterium]